MTLTMIPPSLVELENVERDHQESATMGPPIDRLAESSSSVVPSDLYASSLSDFEAFVVKVLARISLDESHSSSTSTLLAAMSDSKLRRFGAWEAPDVQEDVMDVKRKREHLFSQAISISNLPRRRPSIPRLGLEIDEDE